MERTKTLRFFHVGSIQSLESVGSGRPRFDLLLPETPIWRCLRLGAAFTASFVICCLSIIGQLLPMYCDRHRLRINWKALMVKADDMEEHCNLFQLVEGSFRDGNFVSSVFLFLWAVVLPHVKHAILVHALWNGTRDGGWMPVRVARKYGWLEGLGRLAFFDQWVTAAHCGLAGVNSSLIGALKAGSFRLDFRFTFGIDPDVGYFVSFAARVFSLILGSIVLTQPRPLAHARISVISFLAPRLSSPQTPHANAAAAFKKTFSERLKTYWRSQLFPGLLGFTIVLNVALLPLACVVPMISIHVQADIEDTFKFLRVRLHRDLKYDTYSIANIIQECASRGQLGYLMACSVAALVIIIPFIRALLLTVAWFANVSHKAHKYCLRAASWCGLLASFDVFTIACIVSVFEVPNIFNETNALFLEASGAPGFSVVCVVAMMEFCLAPVVVRVVAARSADEPVAVV